MRNNKSLALSNPAISAFWIWFSNHHREVEAMLDRDDTAELTRQITAQVDRLSSQLAWEIGPGLVKPYMFVFSIAGNIELEAGVRRLMEASPKIELWEFHAARPPRPFQPEVQLPNLGLTFRALDWKFLLTRSATADRLDLQVFDDGLANVAPKIALTAVFILLDSVLGEDVVERWIGDVKVYPPFNSNDTLPMPIIADRVAELIPK